MATCLSPARHLFPPNYTVGQCLRQNKVINLSLSLSHTLSLSLSLFLSWSFRGKYFQLAVSNSPPPAADSSLRANTFLLQIFSNLGFAKPVVFRVFSRRTYRGWGEPMISEAWPPPLGYWYSKYPRKLPTFWRRLRQTKSPIEKNPVFVSKETLTRYFLEMQCVWVKSVKLGFLRKLAEKAI